MRPALVTIDVGSTLGVFTGPSTEDVLRDLSPLGRIAPHLVAEICHTVLARSEHLSSYVIGTVCDELLIDHAAWPTPWPATGFAPHPDAAEALERLFPLARIVAVTNLAVTERDRMIQMHQAFGRYLFATYPSYELGLRKPSREFWAEIAGRHNTIAERIVHIGGCWTEDALGPSESGARAVWISTTPPPRPDTTGRVHIATSLLDAVQLVAEMCDGEGSHE